MELKGRLKAIADLIPECDTLVDIGTDHAYIPVYAVKNGICQIAVAADVKKGPVEIAKRNANRYGLKENIRIRLGYGLEPVELQECDVVVIAGMGGIMIQEIIEKGLEKAKKANLLILQPMNNMEVLRKWLYENGFDIIAETLSEEPNKIYNIINARWTGLAKNMDDFNCYTGMNVIDKNNGLFEKYAEKKLRMLGTMIEGMKLAEKEAEGLQNLIDIRERLKMVLKEHKNK